MSGKWAIEVEARLRAHVDGERERASNVVRCSDIAAALARITELETALKILPTAAHVNASLKRHAEDTARIAELENALLNVIGGQQDPNIKAEDLVTLACAHTIETQEELAAVKEELALYQTWTDTNDEWTDAIKAAHPSRNDAAHGTYATAMKMVSNRHGKHELVALVSWLLLRIAELEKK